MKKQNYYSVHEEAKGLKYRILYLLSTALIVLSGIFLSGCGESSYFENRDSGVEKETGISMYSGQDANSSAEKSYASGAETSDTTESDADDSGSPKGLFVQIAGAVQNPGVYEMRDGDRVFQVIEKAGGLTDDAYEASVNQARKVSDGDFIRIYTVAEAESYMKDGTLAGLIENDSRNTTIDDGTSSDAGGGLINLNSASKEELMTLPGIGESRAEDIISYRTKNGSFKSIDDIKNISGIKEKAFAKIKDLITV